MILKRVARSIAPPPQAFRIEPPSPNGFERIYHVHIRKCGGTSVNKMFIGAFSSDADVEYERLATHWRNRISVGGRPFVGWNRRMIERGAYFFGFSHLPFDGLQLPSNTYTFTLFRDPVARVLSHYKMLLGMQRDASSHPAFETEGAWLGNGFGEFIEAIPKEHLCNQLFMFSRGFDLNEAIEKVGRITRPGWLADLPGVVADINAEFGLTLKPTHTRRADIEFEPSNREMARLRDRLKDELSFVDRLVGCIA